MKLTASHLEYIRALRRRRDSVPAIRIELVAEKLRALRAGDFQEPAQQLETSPRLAELLLFLEWLSHQPGGLEKGIKDLLFCACPENIGTPELHAARQNRDGHFDHIEDLVSVWESIPERFRTWPAELNERHRDTFNLWLLEEPTRLRAIERESGEQFRKLIATITPDYCWRLCVTAAAELLPRLIADLCNQPSQPFPDERENEKAYLEEWTQSALHTNAGVGAASRPRKRREVWYFQNLTESLFTMIDRHASNVLESIAQTDVVKLIFGELDFAISSGVPVFIAGDSRFGKTVAHRTWCQAYPGRCRIVDTPPTGREWDFYIAHAIAFGIAYTGSTNQRKLSREVQFVIRQTGLALFYDEAHHLLPSKVSRNSKPWRMDWIRCHVIDCGIPAAFIATRQTYGQNLAQFVKATHHQMEQWFDRLHRPMMLPGEISRADVLAVAAKNFPKFPKRLIETIGAEALMADSPFHAITIIAKRSAYFAGKAGREIPSDADVNAAIEDWTSRPSQRDFESPIPPSAATSKAKDAAIKPRKPAPGATAPQPAGSRPAKGLQAPSTREISPVNTTANRVAIKDEGAPVLVG